MAITYSNLGSGSDGAGGFITSLSTSANVTVTANRLTLAIVRNDAFNLAQAGPPDTVVIGALSFTLVDSAADPTTAGTCISLWRAMTASPPSAAVATASWSHSMYDGEIAVIDADNVDTSGTNGSGAIVQVQKDFDSSGSATAKALTLAAFGNANNGTLYATGRTNPGATIATCTPDTGYTEAYDFGTTYASAGASGSLEVQYRASNDTSPTGTWSAAGYINVIAVEIKASGTGTTTKVMSDTVSVTDTALDASLRIRQIADTLTLSDTALDSTCRVRQMTDTTVVTDNIVQWRRLKRVMDEAVTVIDSFVKTVFLGGAVIYTKVMSDALVAVDFAVEWLRRVRGPIDTVTLSDGDTYRTSIVTASESLDIADGFVSWRRLVRVAQDNISLIEGFSKTLSSAGIVYAKVMSDTVILVDDAGQRWKLRVSQLTDAIGLSDQVIRYLRSVRSLGDVVELSDGTVKIRRMIKSMDESIEVTDDRISTLYLDQISNTSFSFGSSGPPFRFGGT